MTQGLGERIRAARLARGMSLRATAADAAISPSLLSQVETGKVHPSVSTLYTIVTTLGLSMDDVLGREESDGVMHKPTRVGPVQPLSAAPEIDMQNGVTWRGLASMDTGDGADSVLATYQPGASSSVDDTHMRHAGVEYGYIIRGELTLKLDFETYVLHAGDSVCFDSTRPHLYVNHTDAVAEGVWFVLGMTRDGAQPLAASEIRTAADVLGAIGRLPGPTDS
jgi:transcriptional regulator with XRE-family HTH domain